MNILQNRSWMYNRLMLDRRGYTDAFLQGVDDFVSYACQETNVSNGKIRCPCSKCKNLKFFHFEEVKVHLYKKGFMPEYWYWTCHGESDPTICVDTSPTIFSSQERHLNKYKSMVYDVAGLEYEMDHDQEINESPNMDESPNIEAQKFYELLDAAKNPLWPGCNNHTELSFVLRFLTIKLEGNMSHRSCDQTLALMKETHPTNNIIPKDFYKVNKIVSKLGLTAKKKIDCCVDGCMLFYTIEDM